MDLPTFPADFLFPRGRRNRPEASFDRWEPIASGTTGSIHKLSQDTVVKFPLGDSEANELDIELEHQVYLTLGHHPRILQLQGTLGSGLLFDYQPGGTIRDFLQTCKNGVKDVKLFRWAIHISQGLAYVHAMGVIQADVSLSNVLVTEQQDAVICDFSSASLNNQRTSTTCYELRSRRPSIEERFTAIDDIFALGSALYEMETGHPPYHHKVDEKVEKLFTKGSFPSTRGLLLGDVIKKCWNSNYCDASEVLDDIRKFSLLSRF